MTQEYGSSGAPTEGVVSSQQRQDATADQAGAAAAAQTLEKESVVAEAEDGLVAYVAAAEFANHRWLVKAGEPVYLRQEGATSPGMRSRDGDVWAKFVNGVLVTDKPEVIAWCEAHPTICRRETDPSTKAWATLKALQTRLANRERLLDPTEMNADESFPVNGAGNLHEQPASPDSAGGQAVESARLSRESIQQERAAGRQS
jgi:hypothetical protein